MSIDSPAQMADIGHRASQFQKACDLRRRDEEHAGRGEDGALLGEQAVRDSGAPGTIVRASFFCQNFSENFLLEPMLGGEVAFPAGHVKEPFIDAEDVADVATAALTEDGHAGQLYEVTAPRLLTFYARDAAASGVWGASAI